MEKNLTCLKSRITENKTYLRSEFYSSVATQTHIVADSSSPDCMVGEGLQVGVGVCSACKEC